MQMKRVMRAALVAALCSISACGITEPKPLLDEFSWESVENQAEVTEGVNIAGFFGDISFLGQAKTPTLCYSVASKLGVEGNTLTLTIDITASGSGTCTQQAGGVRYSGAIRSLGKGTYTVHI